MLVALLTCAFMATSSHLGAAFHLVWPLVVICWILLPVVSIRGLKTLASSVSRTEKARIGDTIVFAPLVAFFLVGAVMVFVLGIGIC